MKSISLIFCLFLSICAHSQTKEINLSNFKLCDLTLNDLKQKYPDLEKINVNEMNLCINTDITDSRFENKIGYSTKLLPGVIFQKSPEDNNNISKIHLTRDFKGILPDGTFVDMLNFNLEKFKENKPDSFKWFSRDCLKYWILSDESFYFYVEINKNKTPKYPLDEEFYKRQLVVGIDIVENCYNYDSKKEKPLCIVDGKEMSFEDVEKISPNSIETVTVLKDAAATAVYGKKGENGVIIILLKK